MTKVTVSTTLYERTHGEKPSKSTYYGFWSFRLGPVEEREFIGFYKEALNLAKQAARTNHYYTVVVLP
jgi:hypothetical protein